MRPTPSVAILILVAGCHPHVRAAFEATFDEVLAPPAPLPEDWAPDAVLRVSPALFGDLVTLPLEDTPLAADVSLASTPARAQVGLRDVVVDLPGTPCTCVAVDGVVEGTLAAGPEDPPLTAPLTGAFRADVEVAPDPHRDGVDVTARTALVTRAEARFAAHPDGALAALRTDPLSRWLGDALPAVTLARFGGTGDPVRAVRVEELWPGLRLDVRTAARSAAVAEAPPVPEGGWIARVHHDTVLDLARRAAFRTGPVVRGHWVDPRRLELAEDGFTVDVRVWKPRSHWQDWRVAGPLVLEDGAVRFRPESLAPLGASRERLPPLDIDLVLRAAGLTAHLEEAVAAALPRNGSPSPWRVTGLAVVDGDLVLRGGEVAEPGAEVSASR